jgi:hypothetical protein
MAPLQFLHEWRRSSFLTDEAITVSSWIQPQPSVQCQDLCVCFSSLFLFLVKGGLVSLCRLVFTYHTLFQTLLSVVWVWVLCYDRPQVKVKVKVTLRLTVSQSLSLGVEPHLGFMTRYLLLFVTVLFLWGALSDEWTTDLQADSCKKAAARTTHRKHSSIAASCIPHRKDSPLARWMLPHERAINIRPIVARPYARFLSSRCLATRWHVTIHFCTNNLY